MGNWERQRGGETEGEISSSGRGGAFTWEQVQRARQNRLLEKDPSLLLWMVGWGVQNGENQLIKSQFP